MRITRRFAPLILSFLLAGLATAPGHASETGKIPPAAVAEAGIPVAGEATAVSPPEETPGGETESRTPAPGDEAAPVPDPLEPVNRAFFAFNDRAYRWVLEPVAQGYAAVVPGPVRTGVRNVFANLATPVRAANDLLQGEFRALGTELLRFAVNSTLGVGGLFDPARDGFQLYRRDTDLGVTLGRYGLGHGFYLVFPLLGPSSFRDTVGSTGDAFLDPLNHVDGWEATVGLKAYRMENELSLRIGRYEELTGTAPDPYLAVRDAYFRERDRKLSR